MQYNNEGLVNNGMANYLLIAFYYSLISDNEEVSIMPDHLIDDEVLHWR